MLKKSAIKEAVEKIKSGEISSTKSRAPSASLTDKPRQKGTSKKLEPRNSDLIGKFLPTPGGKAQEHFNVDNFEISQLLMGVDLPQTPPSIKEKPLLKVKRAEEIDEVKPVEIIEPLIFEKRTLSFISDLAIPAQKLSKLFKVETTYTEDTLSQILTAWKDSEKIIKWSAKLDKHGQEFYALRGEGLMKMKDNPPVYGMEFDDGAIISTHIGEYTFIMGCYHFDVKSLVKIFAYGIENAKRFNL